MSRHVLRTALALALVTYPLLVWFGLDRFGIGAMALLLGLLAGARMLVLRGRFGRSLPYLLAGVILFVATVALTHDERLLRFYPVLVSCGLLLLCVASLLRPPSLLERMLRLWGRPFPPEAVPWLRGVTVAWAIFFAVNATIAAWTALVASRETWVFYNGFLSYLLIAALIGLEWLLRPLYRRYLAGRPES